MKAPAIEALTVAGFLSIREAEVQFDRLNVLIGSNGSGKSNLLRLFTLLQAIADGSLQEYVGRSGGADTLLYYGSKQTQEIRIRIRFAHSETLMNGYRCRLVPASGDTLYIAEEVLEFRDRSEYLTPYAREQGGEREESLLPQPESNFTSPRDRGVAHYVRQCLLSYRVYHFHDTSTSARVKKKIYIGDNLALHSDGGNLSAMLLRMREEHPVCYGHLIDFIRLCAPFFGDFVLTPSGEPETVILNWRERGSEVVFPPDALSDGTLRFICLATLLLQPPEWMSPILLIDEPELGLHPFAIHLIGEAMRKASLHSQIIVSTQSPLLLDVFELEEVIVAERTDEGSQFHRLQPDLLQEWLKEYSLGEIWEKNLIGGRPPR